MNKEEDNKKNNKYKKEEKKEIQLDMNEKNSARRLFKFNTIQC